MKISFLIILVCCLNACSLQSQNRAEVSGNYFEPVEKPKEVKPLEKLIKTSEKILLPEIKSVYESALIRHSEIKDDKGWMSPPYKSANIVSFFNVEPKVGEKVTVIPLNVEIEPFQLEISEVFKTPSSNCPDENNDEFIWKTELDIITDKEILEFTPPQEGYNKQMPFGAFVIYPSVEFAQSLPIPFISSKNLPKNIARNRIQSAIDIDNDNAPDLLTVLFCCGEPEKESAENCPYACSKYYKKIGETWKIINTLDFHEMC
jgi:hypothetical protein